MEHRLAAILVADVIGYSHLVEVDEAGTLAALRIRRTNILQPLIVKFKGRIVKLMGDGVLVEFASTVNAVQCAVDSTTYWTPSFLATSAMGATFPRNVNVCSFVNRSKTKIFPAIFPVNREMVLETGSQQTATTAQTFLYRPLNYVSERISP
jgi:hypothetical protein